MSRRITITIEDGIEDGPAISAVQVAIAAGRISTTRIQGEDVAGYCHLIRLGTGMLVHSRITRTFADSFSVTREAK